MIVHPCSSSDIFNPVRPVTVYPCSSSDLPPRFPRWLGTPVHLLILHYGSSGGPPGRCKGVEKSSRFMKILYRRPKTTPAILPVFIRKRKFFCIFFSGNAKSGKVLSKIAVHSRIVSLEVLLPDRFNVSRILFFLAESAKSINFNYF